MEHAAAGKLARELMDEHGLADWRLEWGRGKRTLGTCIWARQTIRLSAFYVSLNDEDHVRDTILHEIAHALAGETHGHDEVWKATCRRIGADPTRVAHEVNTPAAPYELYCPCCDSVVGKRYRRVRWSTLERMGCRTCGQKSMGKLVFRRRLAG